jgi:hypothetical protein
MIGILTGCGISTVFIVPFPIDGYQACVPPILWNAPVATADFVGVPRGDGEVQGPGVIV